jgi:sulfur carrier protein
MIEVDGRQLPWSDDMTIASLLAELGEEKFCAVVRMNGRLVSSPDFETTPVPDKAQIRLLPLVAGG